MISDDALDGSNGASMLSMASPAEDVRVRYRKDGWIALSLQEQQWTMLDKTLHPHLYEWLVMQEKEEDEARKRMGKQPKIRKLNPAVEPFCMSRYKIEWALDRDFMLLNRTEIMVRKLLSKYHDPVKIKTRKMLQEEREIEKLRVLEGRPREDILNPVKATERPFDAFLCERTRAKSRVLFNR